jgi:hypothetical protein
MPEPTSDKHYEEKFEFALWKLIKQCAEEKDISYVDAYDVVYPEFAKTIRYGDKKFEQECITQRYKDMLATYERDGLIAGRQREYVEEADRFYKGLSGG